MHSKASVKIPDRNRDLKQLLPPQDSKHKGKKTMVLDLDETLVHAKFTETVEKPSNHFFKLDTNNIVLPVHVYVRPGAQDFIREMSKYYELVIFTASKPSYANKVIDLIDPDNLVAYRLFRDSCVEHTIINEEGRTHSFWVKDMSRMSRYIDDIVLIDNSPSTYIYQKENGMPITSWTGNEEDAELYQYLNIFKMIAKFNIDIKYTLLNIIKVDKTIDHDKFADIINSAIRKENFAVKTKEYRKAHEMSLSPQRTSNVMNTYAEKAATSYQIQTDYYATRTIGFDSEISNLQTLNPFGFKVGRCKSSAIRIFEETTCNNNLYDRYNRSLKLKKNRSANN